MMFVCILAQKLAYLCTLYAESAVYFRVSETRLHAPLLQPDRRRHCCEVKARACCLPRWAVADLVLVVQGTMRPDRTRL